MSVTDNFNRADGHPSGWTDTLAAGISIATNQAKGDTVGDQCAARYTDVSWNNDHASQAVRANASNYPAVAVRMSAGGDYYSWFSHGSVQEMISGSAAEIGLISEFSSGQTAKLSATGTTLEVFIGGVSQGTVVDATLTTGNPGLAFYDTTARADDWEGTGEVGVVFLAERQTPVFQAVHRASIY